MRNRRHYNKTAEGSDNRDGNRFANAFNAIYRQKCNDVPTHFRKGRFNQKPNILFQFRGNRSGGLVEIPFALAADLAHTRVYHAHDKPIPPPHTCGRAHCT